MSVNKSLIEIIRASSRTMVRELGFMQSTLAATEYSPSAVHALLEIDRQKLSTAAQLVGTLGLEKSTISRMISKLIDAGEIEEVSGVDDGRVKQLVLTLKGQSTIKKINEFGEKQVKSALQYLNTFQQQQIAQGLSAYAQALQLYREHRERGMNNSIQINTGYQAGLIGRIAEMHASFYSKHSCFGRFFESQVASGVAEFSNRLDKPCNQVWTATLDRKIVGSIAIDGEDLGNDEAHLRWFILDDGCRGGGVGRALLTKAVEFCDENNFSTIQLWTFKGLDAARKLYESLGFELTKEEAGDQWGTTVIEQQFTRKKINV